MNERVIKSAKIGPQEIILETGYLAGQAHGAVVARQGDTMVIATVVTAAPSADVDYFPLNVNYEERLYAGGIIKGSRFVKREGRPRDEAVLSGRLIDRSIRPLFPKDFNNEVQIIATVLSVDDDNDPVALALVATSAALKNSGIPWNGPIGGVGLGLVEGAAVVSPTKEQRAQSQMDLFVSGTADHVVMVEMGGNEVAEEVVLDAIYTGHGVIGDIIKLINDFAELAVAKQGYGYKVPVVAELTEDQKKEQEALVRIEEYMSQNFPPVLLDATSAERHDVQEAFLQTIFTEFEGKTTKAKMSAVFDQVAKKMVRKKVLETKERVDGRKLDQVRQLTIEVGLLPRTHGSAMFRRGDTQVVNVTTLGSTALELLTEGMHGEEVKRYFHHYNFPPFSTGETGRIGSPGRREIGHGALAERALIPVLPTDEKFPYTIRTVSEVLSSNGSTSMASVCGSTLSLMDAGVPIKEPVSGIAMGLIQEGDQTLVLTDIMGVEDFYGDMDFKVAGTKNGLTALQMDVKIPGLTREILTTALAQAKVGRAHILAEMLKVLAQPREGLSIYAPKIQSIKINPSKIGDVIGPGGKIIRSIQEETGTEIDIEEDGMVHVAGRDVAGVQRAIEEIRMITTEVEVGKVYMGRVTRIMDFGAFVEVLPGKEGLVHVSELAPGFVKNVRDEVSEGDEFEVKCIEIDSQGRVNLSRKAAMGDQRSAEQN